jgi:small GTP-binding protein
MAGNIEPDFMFKLIIVGDSGVGKTNILTKFTDNAFREDSKPTIGVELAIKTFIVDKHIIKAQIWDTAGQERFRAITAAYYRKALGIIMAFDLTSARSFEHLTNWYQELEAYGEPNVVVLLVGNKSDLAEQREVPLPSIEAFAAKRKCLYLETSAATGDNIEATFNLLVKGTVILYSEVYEKHLGQK